MSPPTDACPPADDPTAAWSDPATLVAQQSEVGRLAPGVWTPPGRDLRVAGCFVAFARGEQGPGRAGDRAVVGAALVAEGGTELGAVVVDGRADGPYRPGLLALREGRMLVAALRALFDRFGRPDVLVVDATGRDHPRRCGLAVHLGWVLRVPSLGVTHRLLTGDQRDPPAPPPSGWRRGVRLPVVRDGEPVAAWVCTRDGARPVAVHAGWRLEVEAAVAVALRSTVGARTPEPLRAARRVAREARSLRELRGHGSRAVGG